MADESRLERIRRRLAERRAPTDAGGGSGTGGDTDDPAPIAEAGSDQKPITEAGSDQNPTLGDLSETRREAISRRLRGIRERAPSVSVPRPDLRARADRIAVPLGAALDRVREVVARAAGAVAIAWFGLSLELRQRLAAGAGLVAVLALGYFVLLPLAPCWVPGGDRCPPDDDAISLVPADAGAYIHANVDTETDQYEAAVDLFGRVPDLRAEITATLSFATGRPVDYDQQIRAWSGGEVALVLAPDGLGASRMAMFEVTNTEGAMEFAATLLGGGVTTTEVEGTSMQTNKRGLSSALTGGFLLIGAEELVRESATLSRVDSLAVDQQASDALDTLPEDRLAAAYLSADLARALGGSGDLGAFNTFVNARASEGVAAAITVDDEGADLAVRSIQDERVVEQYPDFFSALPLYEPELTEQVAADALVYMGLGDPGASAATLAGQAAATAPDLFSGLKAFNRRLRRQGGVDIEAGVLPLLEGEAALTVEPEPVPEDGGGDEVPGVVAPTGVPYLALLATGVDADAVARDLAELQLPIAEAVDPAAGQSPVFESVEIAGVAAQSLRLSRVVELTYATFDDELIVGTSPAAVERVRADGEKLADSGAFKAATDEFPDQLSLLLYLDFRDLLEFGERLFLAEDPSYARFAEDLRTLDAAALAIRRTRAELSTDIRVTVGEREAPDPTSPGLGIEPE